MREIIDIEVNDPKRQIKTIIEQVDPSDKKEFQMVMDQELGTWPITSYGPDHWYFHDQKMEGAVYRGEDIVATLTRKPDTMST